MERKGRRMSYCSFPSAQRRSQPSEGRAQSTHNTWSLTHSPGGRALAEPISRFVAWKYLIPGSTHMAPHRTGGTLIEYKVGQAEHSCIIPGWTYLETFMKKMKSADRVSSFQAIILQLTTRSHAINRLRALFSFSPSRHLPSS